MNLVLDMSKYIEQYGMDGHGRIGKKDKSKMCTQFNLYINK